MRGVIEVLKGRNAFKVMELHRVRAGLQRAAEMAVRPCSRLEDRTLLQTGAPVQTSLAARYPSDSARLLTPSSLTSNQPPTSHAAARATRATLTSHCIDRLSAAHAADGC